MPGTIFIDKATGKPVTFYGEDAANALSSGNYEAPKEGVEVQSPEGNVSLVHSAEELHGLRAAIGGYSGLDPEQALGREKAATEKALYTGSPENTIQAFGQGTLSGLTLGTSDWLLPDAGKLAQFHPGAHVTGSLLGAAGALPAIGAVGGAAGGGLLGATAEGAVFGFGQGSSNLALSNEPLTAESVVGELLKQGALGAGLGFTGGLIGKGFSAVASRAGAKAATAEAELAAKAASVADEVKPVVGGTSADATSFTSNLKEATNSFDQAADILTKEPVGEVSSSGAKLQGGDVSNSLNHTQDTAETALDFAPELKKSEAYAAYRQAEKDLSETLGVGKRKSIRVQEAYWNERDKLTGLTKTDELLNALPVEKQISTAKALEAYNEAATSLAEQSGLGVDAVTAQRQATYLANIRQVSEATAIPAVEDASLIATRRIAKAQIEETRAAFREALGTDKLDEKGLRKFLAQDMPSMQKTVKAMADYHEAIQGAAEALGYPESLAHLQKAQSGLEEAFGKFSQTNPAWDSVKGADLLNRVGEAGGVPTAEKAAKPGILGRVKGLGTAAAATYAYDKIPNLPLHADEMIKVWLATKAIKGLGLNGVIAKGAGKVLSMALPGGTGKIAAATLGRLMGSTGELAEKTGATIARAARATESLASGAAKASKVVAPTALKLMNSLSFSEQPPVPHKNLQAAYKAKLEELSHFASNADGIQTKINDSLAPMRRLSLGLGDKLEMQLMRVAQFLFDKAPKDPGTLQTLGRSTWKPNEQQILEWSNYLRAVDDPSSVWERTVSGRVTPQEADALRTLYPAHFEEIQKNILNNLPAIQKNATYDQQIRMGILFDVPTNSVMNPDFIQFVQQDFVARAAEAKPMKFPGPSNPKETESLTSAQKLQSR